MKQKELSRWLQAIVIVCWILCAVMGVYVMPRVFALTADVPPTPWRLAAFWVALIPVIAALWQGWLIFGEIGRDNSFCLKNARRLKIISFLAAGDTILAVIYSIVLAVLNALHPMQLIVHLAIVFVGIAVTIAAAALSHLTHKAAILQDENELTI